LHPGPTMPFVFADPLLSSFKFICIFAYDLERQKAEFFS